MMAEQVSLSLSYLPFQSHVCVCVWLMVRCSFPPGLAGSALHLHIRPSAGKITLWNHHYSTRGFRTLISNSGMSAGSTVWWPLVWAGLWVNVCAAAAWHGLVDLCQTGLIANHTSKSLAMDRSTFYLLLYNKTSNYHRINHLVSFTSKWNLKNWCNFSLLWSVIIRSGSGNHQERVCMVIVGSGLLPSGTEVLLFRRASPELVTRYLKLLKLRVFKWNISYTCIFLPPRANLCKRAQLNAS